MADVVIVTAPFKRDGRVIQSEHKKFLAFTSVGCEMILFIQVVGCGMPSCCDRHMNIGSMEITVTNVLPTSIELS
jgi:hypothetical protein